MKALFSASIQEVTIMVFLRSLILAASLIVAQTLVAVGDVNQLASLVIYSFSFDAQSVRVGLVFEIDAMGIRGWRASLGNFHIRLGLRTQDDTQSTAGCK
jgi:hypothetical protein